MVLHFFGGVLSAWYLVDLWGYQSYWWIWGLFSLVPALLEVGAFIGIFVLKVKHY